MGLKSGGISGIKKMFQNELIRNKLMQQYEDAFSIDWSLSPSQSIYLEQIQISSAENILCNA